MPITDKTKYPREWLEIRARILERAGHCCEGSPKYPDCRAENGRLHPVTGSRVVLTIAHLDHGTHDHGDENLKAMCQRCHLTYDAQQHADNAARTNALRKSLRDVSTMVNEAERLWNRPETRSFSVGCVVACVECLLRLVDEDTP